MSFLNSHIGRLRLLAMLEGTSLILLVFVTLPLRRFFDYALGSQILGPIHGTLFLLFVLNTLRVGIEKQWRFRSTTWKVLVACLIPFGTFYVDRKILKPIHQEQEKTDR